jgi:DNA-binding XRE family transcriptional regulator
MRCTIWKMPLTEVFAVVRVNPMGRPLKNANHPLARLRRQLSDGYTHQMTRAELAKKTGIPERSLQDIEAGKYKLTHDVAIKIAAGTDVDANSLLRGDDPLLNYSGEPLDAFGMKIDFQWNSLFGQTRKHLLEVAWEAAVAKHRSCVLSNSFDEWLITTVHALDLKIMKGVIEKMRLFLIDPEEIPFDPGYSKQAAAVWKKFVEGINQEIKEEQLRLMDAYQRKGGICPNEFIFRKEAIENLQKRKAKAELTRAA